LEKPIYKVSVVIPAYNSEKYIERTLKSVLSQTLDSIEIIVVENGSTDKTYEIANKVLSSQSRFAWKLIRLEEANVGRARNIGIQNVRGKYVYFLDSDDFINDSAIERLYKICEEKQADFAFFGFNRVNESGQILVRYDSFYKCRKSIMSGIKAVDEYLDGNIWIATGTYIFKRTIIEENDIKFSEESAAGEDQTFVINVLLHTKRVVSDCSSMLSYTVHGNGLSSSDRVFEAVEAFHNLQKEVSSMKNLSPDDKERIVSKINYFKIPYLYLRGYFRFAKTTCYKDFKEHLKKNRKKIRFKINYIPFNKIGFSSLVGYILLTMYPRLFYNISRKFKMLG